MVKQSLSIGLHSDAALYFVASYTLKKLELNSSSYHFQFHAPAGMVKKNFYCAQANFDDPKFANMYFFQPDSQEAQRQVRYPKELHS